MRISYILMFFLLSACSIAPAVEEPTTVAENTQAPQIRLGRARVEGVIAVVETVEPVAEAFCLERTTDLNCDFQIVVDDTAGAPPNAFQTQDDTGRPVIAFTLSLLAEARNPDELAFIMSHEAAHHILGHIARQNQNAKAGAQILGSLAYIISGGSEESIRAGVQLGAEIGARTYSKDFELEADALGTLIAARAGFDPLRGAEFFFRIPDPGNKFLGTHPANAARLATVQRVASQL
jgi:predicted Zn-dependent protease